MLRTPITWSCCLRAAQLLEKVVRMKDQRLGAALTVESTAVQLSDAARVSQ